MSIWTRLRSQLINLKVFRPYFPLGKTLSSAITFPIDYAGNGKTGKFPSIINFNITTRCNFKCEFCFNKDNNIGLKDELSLDEIKKFIRSSAKHRPGFFLTGGEPFSRKDIFEILDAIKRYSLPAGVVTNGALLNEEKIDRLLRIGLDVAIISFHGTELIHDRIVGKKGAYKKAMASLKYFAKKMPSPGPMINYIVSEDSTSCLKDFLDETRELENVVVRLSHLNFLTHDEVGRHMTFWEQRFEDVPLEILTYEYQCRTEKFEEVRRLTSDDAYDHVLTKPILSDNEFMNWYSNDFTLGTRCVFIWKSTFLNSDGTVYPCQFLYIPMGNIREKPMEEIWNNDLYKKYRTTLKEGLMPGCSRCCKI